MVRPTPAINVGEGFSAIPLAIGLFVSATLLVALCAKHGKRVARKLVAQTSEPNTPKASPVETITHKAKIPLFHAKKSWQESDTGNKEGKDEGGVWQKAILMGEKCRPPEFSGVIYYDYSGNRVPEMPKSPRASPLRSFTLAVQTAEAKSMY